MSTAGDIAITTLQILAPVIMVGATAFVGWIAPKVASIIGAKNDQLLRDALHKSAMNGLQFAATKAGQNAPLSELTAIAIKYVKEMSPDTVAKTGVDDAGLAAIVASKVQEQPDINPMPPRDGP